MNWQLLIPLLVTTCLAMTGWIVVHHLSRRRDIQNKRREIRVKYLINAYRNIEAGAERPGGSDQPGFGRPFESAIADVLLFGNLDQIQKAKELALDISAKKKGITAPLLYLLRDDLRKELGLMPTDEELVYFRWLPASEESATNGRIDSPEPPT